MARTISLDLAERVRIAAPCPMRWNDMEPVDGQRDSVRHCHACDLNVYNFSNMGDDDIERTLRDAEGRLCAGYFRRADGTVMAKDCPVGVRFVRARARRVASRIVAALGLVLTGGVLFGKHTDDGVRIRHTHPFQRLCERLSPSTPPPAQWIGGLVCPPMPPIGTPAGCTDATDHDAEG